jgi:hypothetical protein
LQLIREQTDEVLQSESILKCKTTTLEAILQQSQLHNVTELDLFKVCAKYAESQDDPRASLGNALGLVRFRNLTAEDFARYVLPSKLLSSSEEKDILLCIVNKESTMPSGFSNEISPRCDEPVLAEEQISPRCDEPVLVEGQISPRCNEPVLAEGQISPRCDEPVLAEVANLEFYFLGENSIRTAKELADIALRFRVKPNLVILGVRMVAARIDEDISYEEIVEVALSCSEGKTLAKGKFQGMVCKRESFGVKFDPPCHLIANTEYKINVIFGVPEGGYLYAIRKKQSCSSRSLGLNIFLLEDVVHPIRSFDVAKKR